MIFKQGNDLFTLARAHQAGINIDTGQLIANGLMEQHRRHRTIHPAGQTANNFAAADLRANFGDRLILKGVHRPIALTSADIAGKILQQLTAMGGVHDLRVELYAIEFARIIPDQRKWGAL